MHSTPIFALWFVINVNGNMNQKHQTSIVYLSQITVYPNQMSVHYKCNLKNCEGFFVTRDTGKSKVRCFLSLSPSQCVSKANVGALSVTLRLTGNFFIVSVARDGFRTLCQTRARPLGRSCMY